VFLKFRSVWKWYHWIGLNDDQFISCNSESEPNNQVAKTNIFATIILQKFAKIYDFLWILWLADQRIGKTSVLASQIVGRSRSMYSEKQREILWRNRFDASGRGLGVAGRRDIRDLPKLWAAPSTGTNNTTHFLLILAYRDYIIRIKGTVWWNLWRWSFFCIKNSFSIGPIRGNLERFLIFNFIFGKILTGFHGGNQPRGVNRNF